MKRRLHLLPAMLIALFATSGTAIAKQEKVTICHKDKNTLSVAEAALPAHLGHGDFEGECPPPEAQPEPGTEDPTPVDDNETTTEPEAPACTVPVEGDVEIVLEDGSTYLVELLSRADGTWTYQIGRESGKDLSHWLLGIEGCFDAITDTSAGAEIGRDGSTDLVGVKWEAEGIFSITLDDDYPPTLVPVTAKAGNGFATEMIVGPDCSGDNATEDGMGEEDDTPPADNETDVSDEEILDDIGEETGDEGTGDEATGDNETEIPSEVMIELDDGSTYFVALVDQMDTSWTYQVDEDSGKDLSHWVLLVPECLDHVVSADDGAVIGFDGSTGLIGIKWESDGVFSFELDALYPTTEIEAIAKAGNGFAAGTLQGPDCTAEPIEPTEEEGDNETSSGEETESGDDGTSSTDEEEEAGEDGGLPVCEGPGELANLPAEQELLLTAVQEIWPTLSEEEPDVQLELLREMDFPRAFLFDGLLFVPSMQIPGVELTIGDLTFHFFYSALIRVTETEDGVEYEIIATWLEQTLAMEELPEGDYNLDDMTLVIPVVDLVGEDGSVSSFNLNLTLVQFDPFVFQPTGSENLADLASDDEGDDEEDDQGDDEEDDEEDDQEDDEEEEDDESDVS